MNPPHPKCHDIAELLARLIDDVGLRPVVQELVWWTDRKREEIGKWPPSRTKDAELACLAVFAMQFERLVLSSAGAWDEFVAMRREWEAKIASSGVEAEAATNVPILDAPDAADQQQDDEPTLVENLERRRRARTVTS